MFFCLFDLSRKTFIAVALDQVCLQHHHGTWLQLPVSFKHAISPLILRVSIAVVAVNVACYCHNLLFVNLAHAGARV